MYCVTFLHGGKVWFATRGRKPTGLAQPEPKCAFKDIKVARELRDFLKRQSSFQNIRLHEMRV